MALRRLGLAIALTVTCAIAANVDSRAESLAKHKLLIQAEGLKTDERIALLEQALKAQPADAPVKIALARAFLQKVRETGDGSYLTRASKLVDDVLAREPHFDQAKRVRNEIEMNMHRFPKVAEYAETMLAEDPSDLATLGVLGDALMEMGQYARAGETYTRMMSLGGNLFTYNRLAYYNFVTGKPGAALGWMSQAIAAGSKSPENEAWCLSEMGDMLFKTGRVNDAGAAYALALRAFPGYHRAHAGLGRLQASQRKWSDAILSFQRSQAVVPLPEYAGALEALYEKTGDGAGAERQRGVIEAVAKLAAANGEKANRNLSLLYSDSGRNLSRALELAQAEFEVRNDVYSYDALSWALYRNGRIAEAAQASGKALALGTPEPSFYFHAGMIAQAGGDAETARHDLAKALALNPHFDIRNAVLAQITLEEIAGRSAVLR